MLLLPNTKLIPNYPVFRLCRQFLDSPPTAGAEFYLRPAVLLPRLLIVLCLGGLLHRLRVSLCRQLYLSVLGLWTPEATGSRLVRETTGEAEKGSIKVSLRINCPPLLLGIGFVCRAYYAHVDS